MNRNTSALAAAIAATLGSAGVADAATFEMQLVSVASFSGNGSSAGNITSSTATFSYDDVTDVLTQTGGTFNIRFTISPTTTLFRHSITGLVIGDGAAATASEYACAEGNFGGNVGASLCGNYNFGANFTNESTATWGPGTTTARTLGGDDMALGPQQNVAAYDNFTTVSWTGTTLTLTNSFCNPLAPGNASGCATTGGANTGYTWVLNAVLPTANPDTASTTRNTAVDIDVLANDTALADPVTVSISSPPDNGGAAEILNNGVACADPCSAPAGDIRIRLTPNAAAGTPTYTENFGYTANGSATTVAVTVNNAVPVAGPVTLNINTVGFNPASVPGSFDAGTAGGIDLGDGGSVSGTTDGSTGTASAAGSTVTYTPDSSFFQGSDSFTYTITDADGETDTGTVTVNIADATPDLFGDSAETEQDTPVNIALDFDAGNGAVADHSFSVESAATDGTCAVTGTTLTYTPDAGYLGADSCDVEIADGDGSFAVATFDFNVVEAAPQPPPSEGGLREDDGGSSADGLILSLLGSGVLLRRRRKA